MLLAGCVGKIPMPNPSGQVQIVLTGFPQPGYPQYIYLSQLSSLGDPKGQKLTCYESIKYIVNGTVAYEAGMGCDSVISIPVFLNPGDVVSLQFRVDSRTILSASDRIPAGSFSLSGGDWNSLPLNGEEYTQCRFSLRGDSGVPRFYSIQNLQLGPAVTSHPVGVGAMIDSNHPILLSEGELNIETLTLPLSNETFKDSEVALSYWIKYYHYTTATAVGVPTGWLGWEEAYRYVRVRQVSDVYYRFLKSWIRHQHNKQTGNYRSDDVLEVIIRGEPSFLYSNVEGGLGIFAARSAPVYLKLEER